MINTHFFLIIVAVFFFLSHGPFPLSTFPLTIPISITIVVIFIIIVVKMCPHASIMLNLVDTLIPMVILTAHFHGEKGFHFGAEVAGSASHYTLVYFCGFEWFD